MKTPTSTITTTGDLGGQKVAMGFHKDSIAHLMAVLTDLYSDPEQAIIREYSTNARDSHVEAGNTNPIRVYTPGPYSPYFRVVDKGVGLSIDDITQIYSQYGASTKRGTNDQVGMLGLGAKSALTLVPQFHLTSVKDGVKIIVSVSRSGDGSGQMEIIDTKSTTESNGVEVSIPIPNGTGGFLNKCHSFFRFWKPGTVLVNDKEPSQLTGTPVGKDFIINHELDSDYVVMGGVAYPVKDGLYKEGSWYWKSMGIVAQVNIGDVDFTPSREQLHYTNKTNETINRLKREFKQEIAVSAVADMKSAGSYGEAWKRAVRWHDDFRIVSSTYKGKPVPHGEIETDTYRTYDLSAGRSYGNSKRRYLESKQQDDLLIITNFANAELTMSSQQRQKAMIYANQQGWTLKKVAAFRTNKLAKDSDNEKFLEDFHVVDWASIKSVVLPRNRTASGVVRTEPYDLWQGYMLTKEVKDFDTSKPIVYFSPADTKEPMRSWLPDNAQIVMLNRNRWEKFVRDWPTAVEYHEAKTKYMKALIAQLTEDDKIIWSYRQQYRSFSWMSPDKIDDPEVKVFIKLINDGKYSDAATKLRGVNPNLTVPRPADPLTKYPMIGKMYGVSTDHIYWYMNSWYNNLKESN